MVTKMNYLLVTHIPFRRAADGSAVVDALWAEDLRGLAAAVGSVTVAAPELARLVPGQSWGTGELFLLESEGIRFVGLPWLVTWPKRWFGEFRLRQTLAREVRTAELVHSSNFFAP